MRGAIGPAAVSGGVLTRNVRLAPHKTGASEPCRGDAAECGSGNGVSSRGRAPGNNAAARSATVGIALKSAEFYTKARGSPCRAGGGHDRCRRHGEVPGVCRTLIVDRRIPPGPGEALLMERVGMNVGFGRVGTGTEDISNARSPAPRVSSAFCNIASSLHGRSSHANCGPSLTHLGCNPHDGPSTLGLNLKAARRASNRQPTKERNHGRKSCKPISLPRLVYLLDVPHSQ